MGTKKEIDTKPPLPPKPHITEGVPQKALDSPPNSTNTTSATQYRPIPKPRLRKPYPLKGTLSRPDSENYVNVSGQASLCDSDSTASNGSSEGHSVPSACPPCCPCVCHYASKNGQSDSPQHEDNYVVQTDSKDSKQHTVHKSTHFGKPRIVPPIVPVPARPLPKEPWQIITTNVGGTTDDDKERVYAEVDMPKDINAAPQRNATTPNDVALNVPSQKPIPTLRKRDKGKIVGQSKHLDNECVIFESLRNEQHRILSHETQENSIDMKKPKGIKDVFNMVKIMVSEEVEVPRVKLCFLPSQKKNKADKTQTIPGKSARKVRQKKLSNPIKSPTPIPSCSPSQSFQTPAKCPEGSGAATLPSSGVEVQRTRNSSNRESKGKDDYSQKMLLESFWQKRFVVRESGILSRLTEEDILLQESVYEVLTTEQSYLERLTVAVNHFLESPELNSAIASQDQKSLFSSMHKMREISRNFLDSLVQKLESSLLCDAICDVVYQYATGPLSAYVDYIRNMPYQKQTLVNLRKENPLIVEILHKLQKDPCCNRQPFDSFLLLPVQRISQLKILMETVLKRAASKSNVQASADAALSEILKVMEVCNREVGKMKQMEELVHLANKIEFECKAFPLVSSSRWLVREGEMTQLALSENIFSQKKNCPVHLILFNDLLLVATKKGSDKYVVHDHVHRALIEVTEGAKVEEDIEGYDLSRVFRLALLTNHRGATFPFLLQASTPEEKDSWLEVLRSEEGVYEEWDCPQVRCIEAYNGQQPDALGLQPEDIIDIIQKTSDGYMEGRRLHDGKRGWFPAECVMEISNEHVQRRYLRQRHHVLQTAANILKRRSFCQDHHTTICFK